MAKRKNIYTPTKPTRRSNRVRARRGSTGSMSSSVRRAAISAAASMVPGGPLVQKAVEYAANSIASSMSRRGSDASMFSTVPPSYSSASTGSGRLYLKGIKLGPSTGRYRGTFKKPRKVKESVETKCLKYGFHTTQEIHGTITDSHAGYIAHSTVDLDGYVYGIQGALLRKLLKKAGISVDDRNARLPLFDYGNSDGFKITYTVYNPADNGFLHYDFVTTNAMSFQQIISGFSDMTAHILAYIRNTTNNEPWGLQLFSSDRNLTDTNWRLASNLNLTSEVITLYSSSKLVVQNRTSGDLSNREGAAVDEKYQLDRVDNMPLAGYLYEFKHGDPRIRNPTIVPAAPSLYKLNSMSNLGLVLIKASELGGSPSIFGKDYQEPPVPKFWGNVAKSSRVILQPGDQKSHYITFKASGKLTNVMKYLRVEGYSVTTGHLQGVAGKSAILGLEEKIRSVATNPIVMVYECEKKIGVLTKSVKPGPMLSYVLETKNDAL